MKLEETVVVKVPHELRGVTQALPITRNIIPRPWARAGVWV